jgi:CheY-like chemotaxis protein
MTTILGGKRVLVVEDELLVALLIEDVLNDENCYVIGPITNLSEAISAARTEDVDVALLDVNLRGEKVYPVAEILAQRDIPFLFLSGYGPDAIPRDRPEWRMCSKPFRAERLIASLVETLRETR